MQSKQSTSAPPPDASGIYDNRTFSSSVMTSEFLFASTIWAERGAV
jgi:hypothetical protein